jgi:hypothetical protein
MHFPKDCSCSRMIGIVVLDRVEQESRYNRTGRYLELLDSVSMSNIDQRLHKRTCI